MKSAWLVSGGRQLASLTVLGYNMSASISLDGTLQLLFAGDRGRQHSFSSVSHSDLSGSCLSHSRDSLVEGRFSSRTTLLQRSSPSSLRRGEERRRSQGKEHPNSHHLFHTWLPPPPPVSCSLRSCGSLADQEQINSVHSHSRPCPQPLPLLTALNTPLT